MNANCHVQMVVAVDKASAHLFPASSGVTAAEYDMVTVETC